ncbi:MAG: hypothetical protein Q7T18_08280 [Sedimentisphaerales bacterium]|nr:hypothetical protein [Sedimentisphaerales bacterium]
MAKKSIEEIVKADKRYAVQAVSFVYEGLGYTAKKLLDATVEKTEPRHVSGQDLARGLRDLALERYGRLAMTVLNHWGIKTTRDFGEIVYLMIEHKWMSAQPTDTVDDFNNVYDFKTAFEDQFQF